VATVSIGLLYSDTQPSVEISVLGDSAGADYVGRRFISINLGENATVIAPGFDEQSAAYARTLGQSLLVAAAEIERLVKPVSVEA
jgi:hypothetical protein